MPWPDTSSSTVATALHPRLAFLRQSARHPLPFTLLFSISASHYSPIAIAVARTLLTEIQSSTHRHLRCELFAVVWVRCWFGAWGDAVAGGSGGLLAGPDRPRPVRVLLGQGESPGWWAGSLAERTGLTGVAEDEAVQRLFAGQDPLTGEQRVAPLWRTDTGPSWMLLRCGPPCGSSRPPRGLRSASWQQASACGTNCSAFPVAGRSRRCWWNGCAGRS
jgi:hypothetical protein